MSTSPVSSITPFSVVNQGQTVRTVEIPSPETPASKEAAPVRQYREGASLQQEQPVEQEPTLKELFENVRDINEFVQNFQRNLKFEVAEDGSRTIIYVINSKTKEVIRQIPPEEVQAISMQLRASSTEGLLVRTKI